jgi:peptide/nickel transport system permease protein
MTAPIDRVGDVASAAPPRVRLRRFLRNRAAVVGAVFLLVLVFVALVPRLVAPYSPTHQSLVDQFGSPNGQHLLGLDRLGRDVLSRVIYGARTSVAAALQGTGIAVLLGVPLGMIGAYIGGRLQFGLDRLNDVLMSIPAILLAIVIVGTTGPSLRNAMIGVGLAFSPRFYRIASAATQDVRGETFIEASRAIGCPRPRILLRHVLPNISNTLIVQASLTIGSVILAEATLSFLGLGVQPPTASWGLMLHDASSSLYEASFLVYGPGAMIVATVFACQLVADGLRDALGGGTTMGGMEP